MDSGEIILRYRQLAKVKKFSILFIIAIFPALFELWETGQSLIEEKESSIQQKNIALRRFNKAMKKKNELPLLEEQLNKTESEMTQARKALPDEFLIDKILEKTSILAEESGVQLLVFDPGKETPSNTAFKYVELSIKLETKGNFSSVVMFYDRLVHLDLLTHIRNFDFRIDASKNKEVENTLKNLDKKRQQEVLRKTTNIHAIAELIIFRTLSDEEVVSIEKANKAKKAKVAS